MPSEVGTNIDDEHADSLRAQLDGRTGDTDSEMEQGDDDDNNDNWLASGAGDIGAGNDGDVAPGNGHGGGA